MSRTATSILFYGFIAVLVVVASFLVAGAMMAFGFPPAQPAHLNVGLGVGLFAAAALTLMFAFNLAFNPLATPKAMR